MAATPAALAQLLGVFAGESRLPLSVMGMGRFGKISRLLLAQSGSALNYGYLDRPDTLLRRYKIGHATLQLETGLETACRLAPELFPGDLPEFSAARRLNAGGADPRKTFWPTSDASLACRRTHDLPHRDRADGRMGKVVSLTPFSSDLFPL